MSAMYVNWYIIPVEMFMSSFTIEFTQVLLIYMTIDSQNKLSSDQALATSGESPNKEKL